MKTFKFYSEVTELGKKWYVDLPEFPGSKDELEMVLGADTMLDLLSEDKTIVEVTISLQSFDGCDSLSFKRETTEFQNGAMYNLDSLNGCPFELEVWLCDVMLYVFNEFPVKIYLKKL